jgi:hypothetical protein
MSICCLPSWLCPAVGRVLCHRHRTLRVTPHSFPTSSFESCACQCLPVACGVERRTKSPRELLGGDLDARRRAEKNRAQPQAPGAQGVGGTAASRRPFGGAPPPPQPPPRRPKPKPKHRYDVSALGRISRPFAWIKYENAARRIGRE